MMENNIFITGPSRTGKSTMVGELLDELGLEAEGLRTPDIREGGRRKGFKLVDIKSGEEGILSHVDQEEGPSVSKYRVNMDDLEYFTERSLESVSEGCDIVVIDEIGTMELYSERFENAVKENLESETPVLAVLHRNQVDRYKKYGRVFTVGRANYDSVKEEVKEELKRILESERDI